MNDLAFMEKPTESQQKQDSGAVAASPFVKWAGGKRAIIPALARHFPPRIDTYWEPFLGGGAVFFAMADRIGKAILADTNEDLITTYRVVKDDVENLIDRLWFHAANHAREDYFHEIRAQKPTAAVDIAARFIYLNKTCFNGLYRVNRNGQFNVPKGNYKNPAICDAGRLRAASRSLAKATFRLGDFSKTVKPAKGDFIYCDPPYDDCFTNYQAGGFNAGDQARLRDYFDSWSKAGARVMVSNSHTPLIRELYAHEKYQVHTIKAPRVISAKASGRGTIKEVIVTNYV